MVVAAGARARVCGKFYSVIDRNVARPRVTDPCFVEAVRGAVDAILMGLALKC